MLKAISDLATIFFRNFTGIVILNLSGYQTVMAKWGRIYKVGQIYYKTGELLM